MSQPPVIMQQVFKSYRRGGVETPVLEGADLVVEQGRCVLLTGPSGSGKTTLLSILGCMLAPDRGSVRIAGQDLQRLSGAARAQMRRERIGFVFQRFELIRGLSALDNVMIPLVLSRAAPRAARERAEALLSAVGLEGKSGCRPARLSGGECQRVALARALAADPALILADEPTASLDERHGLEWMELLRSLTAERGKTAVMVTHDPRIVRFADDVYALRRGRLEACRPAESVVEDAAWEVSR